MSFLKKIKNIFGVKKDKHSKQEEAIKKISATEEMLLKKQENLQKKIERKEEIARKNCTSNRRVSLQALKLKKLYEKKLSQIDSSLSQIDIQREALEGVETNTSVLRTMKSAADAIKVANKNMDIDQVQDTMEDIAETQNMAHEVTHIINNSMAFKQDFDEDELQKELEGLQEEELSKNSLPVKEPENSLSLPEVPMEELLPSSSKTQEEDCDQEHEFYEACN